MACPKRGFAPGRSSRLKFPLVARMSWRGLWGDSTLTTTKVRQAALGHGASRPIPRSRSLRSVVGRRSFTAGCVLRPCRARPPAKPQGSCLCLAGRCALPHAPWQPKTAAGCCDVFFLLHRPRNVMLRAPTSRAAALPTLWVPPLTSLPSALVPVAQGGKKQMPQQPALRARGRRA